MTFARIGQFMQSAASALKRAQGPGDPASKSKASKKSSPHEPFQKLAAKNPNVAKSLGLEKSAPHSGVEDSGYRLDTFPRPASALTPALAQSFGLVLLKSKAVDKIYQQIRSAIEGDLDTPSGVRDPEAVKELIDRHLIVSGSSMENLKVAILIPDQDGTTLRGIVETNYNKLDELGIVGDIKDKISHKAEELLTKTGTQFIDLSKLAKNASGSAAFKLFGKTLHFATKAIKIAEFAKELVELSETLDRGEIPIVGDWIQSNPKSMQSPEIMEKRTLQALRDLAGINEPRKAPKPAIFNGPRPITDHPEDNAAKRNAVLNFGKL